MPSTPPPHPLFVFISGIDHSDVTAKDWQSVCLSKYRELLDYFGKKIPMPRFTGFSENYFLQNKLFSIYFQFIFRYR